MTSTISKKQAAELWANLRTSLLAVEYGVKQIIATRAWEPLGYDTFAACWTAELGDLKLARELRAVVVFLKRGQQVFPGPAVGGGLFVAPG